MRFQQMGGQLSLLFLIYHIARLQEERATAPQNF